MNDQVKKRSSKIVEKQRKVLIEFIKTKPQLSSGRFSQTFTQKDAEVLWQDIANNLNSMGGATKPWQSWRKCWQDIRSRTKMKMGNSKKYFNKTGGGPPIPPEDVLTSFEEDVLDLIKPVSVEGHAIEESVVNFDFNESADEILPSNAHVSDELSKRKDMVFLQENDVQNGQNEVCNGTFKRPRKKRVPKKMENLLNSSAAASSYKDSLDKKNSLKEAYYDQKIQIMKKNIIIKEEQNYILQQLLNKCTEIADQLL